MYIIKEAELLSYWQVCERLNILDEAEKMQDLWIRWHNNNNESVIEKMIKNEKYVLVSKLRFYIEQMLKESNKGKKIIDLNQFNKSLKDEIILYRGGSGVFKKDFDLKRDWISFTADKKRVNTFSEYSGTKASKEYSLDKNDHFWQVELSIKLNDILLYYNVGDSEVIVRKNFIKNAKLIKQV